MIKIGRALTAMGFFACIFLARGQAEEKRSVTCNFSGELGNQMFEIAHVIAYALDNDCDPIFYGISGAAKLDVNFQHVFHRLRVLPPSHGIHFEDYFQSEVCTYSPVPDTGQANMRFSGHFQNEKYFVHHRDYIREIFAPSEKILHYIEKKYGKLETLFDTPTVGVHIRTFMPSARLPDHVGFLGGATWQYFIDAINYFPENYTFLVFSDAPDWVKKNFPPCNRKIKFIKENPHYIDLYFLSLCHHQVVSPESTFSWWGAWLNGNPDKVVIVPHFWQLGATGEDIFPPGWVKIYTENRFSY